MKVSEKMLFMYPSDNVAPTAYLFSAIIGNNVDTQFLITHNLNTRRVVVQVQETSGAEDVVLADVDIEGENTVRVSFSVPPTFGQYRVTVFGG